MNKNSTLIAFAEAKASTSSTSSSSECYYDYQWEHQPPTPTAGNALKCLYYLAAKGLVESIYCIYFGVSVLSYH